MKRVLLWLAPLLGLSGAEPGEPPGSEQVTVCPLGAGGFAVYVGSRLLARDGVHLDLLRGSTLPCHHPLTQALHAPLVRAGGALGWERLPIPLRVHVDPRLPAGQAPLGGIEVHVSSRELLVARTALPQLPPEAWRHELLHSLSAPPPASSEVARRLWLTLEEGLVQYLTATPAQVDGPSVLAPDWEQLALPGYDPHELAHGWAVELAQAASARLELQAALDCLGAAPPAGTLRTLQQAARAFVERCPASVTPVLQQALRRWLPEEWQTSPLWPTEPTPSSAVFSAQAR
jgi:hypothetical protein